MIVWAATKGPRTPLLGKWFRSDFIERKVCSTAQKVVQLCPRAQQNPMIGLGATAPFMKQYFSQNYCTQSSARAIARLSGDGGPYRKPDRDSAVSFHPFFLLFLLFSFICRAFACSLCLLRPYSFTPALFSSFLFNLNLLVNATLFWFWKASYEYKQSFRWEYRFKLKRQVRGDKEIYFKTSSRLLLLYR